MEVETEGRDGHCLQPGTGIGESETGYPGKFSHIALCLNPTFQRIEEGQARSSEKEMQGLDFEVFAILMTI